ncbi:MAG: ABC transporter ATP-binding protein [Actinomycetaceae bacterium]
MTVVLRAEQVSVSFGATAALDNVDLELHEGEMVGLLGPNGSGKSTLLRSCARLLVPTGGRIELVGRDVHSTPTREIARRLAVLPQGPPVPEGLTVTELVRTGRHPHRGPWQRAGADDEQVVMEALARTGLEDMAERDVAHLSGGERQRVWLALVLAQATPVVLLDEPTTFLDLGHQWEVLELVDDLRRTGGLSVLVVLHDLNQAARFCDRLVVLDHGVVVAEGEPSEVLTDSLMRDVFGVDADMLTRDGRPVVLPHAAHRRRAVAPR